MESCKDQTYGLPILLRFCTCLGEIAAGFLMKNSSPSRIYAVFLNFLMPLPTNIEFVCLEIR
jgi:hypothetical protein